VKQAIIITAIALSMIAGAGIASAGAKPYPDPPNTPVYTSRYPAIDVAVSEQSRINALEQEVKDLRGQVGALQLLRTYDIEMHVRERREDQKRVVALEWVLQGQHWPACPTREK
jgi:hypothetical protein